MTNRQSALRRADAFSESLGLRRPILGAPMAGVSPASLAVAACEAGAMGACGALVMTPAAIIDWAASVRAATSGPFQINTWIPDPAPVRAPDHEARVAQFLGSWGPPVDAATLDIGLVDFDAQCEAMLTARPVVMSSIMGLYPPAVVARMKAQGVLWFANVTTVAEARAAVAAGADAVVAQGMEAGGHRGAFDAGRAEAGLVGLFALLPAVVDAVGDQVPVVATGGIADGRTIAAALLLGASAVQIGTGLLRTPEAGLNRAWADAIAAAAPEDTTTTRAFSGRLARAIATDYVRAAAAPGAPAPAPYPVQRALTQPMRLAAYRRGDLGGMQAWAGQAARLAPAEPVGDYLGRIWTDARALLPA